jgi:hypothetical protein
MQMKLQFWGMGLNKEEDEQSSPGRHIHLSLSIEQCHQVQALSHMLRTADKELT